MHLRCFADHCISNAIIEALRAIGVEVVRLRDALPTNAPDAIVLAKAQEMEALVVRCSSSHTPRILARSRMTATPTA